MVDRDSFPYRVANALEVWRVDILLLRGDKELHSKSKQSGREIYAQEEVDVKCFLPQGAAFSSPTLGFDMD